MEPPPTNPTAPSTDDNPNQVADTWRGMTGADGNYLLPGVYSIQLRHWLRSFPIEQFYITTSKSFGDSTAEEMRRIGRHMGLSERELAAASEAALGERQRVGRGDAKTQGAGEGSPTKAGAKAKRRWNHHHTQLTQEQLSELQRFYAPYNAELSRMLKREIVW